MWIVFIIAILCLGAAAAWLTEAWHGDWPRRVALGVVSLCALVALWQLSGGLHRPGGGQWLMTKQFAWIAPLGINLTFAVDALSLLLVVLTMLLGVVAVVASWREIDNRQGFFYFNLLLTLAGVTGVFVSLDLFMFFVFWEIMLVPMYFMIAVWGSERRGPAAMKFFLFMQVSGLLMLASILALAFIHRAHTGTFSFDYFSLYGMTLAPGVAFYIMLGFFLAFAVKLPVFPFHTWVADAYTEAPTGGSILLAGILSKTGAYGLIRFVLPLFPEAAHQIAELAMWMGVVTILYGAVLAFAQTDFKRLIAYSSLSHVGFLMLGIFALNQMALNGVVVQMLAHGFSVAAMFLIAGALSSRLHTQDMTKMGGLWANMPRLGGMAMFFIVATLGMPGLGNFIGEFLVLLGTFKVNITLAVLAALGMVTAVCYALIAMQRTFHGKPATGRDLVDSRSGETAALAFLMVALVALGVYPQPVFHMLDPVMSGLSHLTLNSHHWMGAMP